MICKKCGAKNSDTREKCFNCGLILNTQAVKRPEEYEDYPDDISALVNDEKKDTVSEKRSEPEKRSIEQITIYGADNTDDDDYTVDGADDLSSADQVYTYTDDGDDTYDDEEFTEDEINALLNDEDEGNFVPDNTDADEEAPSKKKKEIRQLDLEEDTEQHFKVAKEHSSTGYTVAIWILVLVFIIVSIFLGVLAYNYFTKDDDVSVDPTIDTITELDLEKPTLQKKTDASGKEYIHAVFKGTPGDRLHLKCNGRYYTFVEEKLEIDLYLEDLFNSDYQFRTASVDANMYAYYVRDGKEYSCEVPAFKMSVPEAELEFAQLTEQTVKVYSDKYTLKFCTATNAKVELNNKNISSSMDGLGNFSYEIQVDANSSTTYSLLVSQPYHMPKSEVFVLTRDALPVALTIAANNSDSKSDTTVTLKCQTEEGVSITSNLPIISSIKNELYNTFEITLDISGCDYGQIEALITATNEKGSSTKAHTITYWPDEETVTRSSNKFTSSVATNSSAYAGKNYVINKVKAIKNTGADKFEGVCELNGVSYTIIINKKDIDANVVINNSYKIFAQCTGESENGIPVFRAWFIYNA